MLKKLSLLALLSATLSACSLSSIPFVGKSKPVVIDLKEDQIDQKSYAIAYESTLQTYQGRVNADYDVNSFASGVNDWYLGRILLPIDQIKQRLYNGGHDSNIFAYYSGVVFASDLQTNFSHLSKDCWSKINTPSLTQGTYDAMRDLQNNKVRAENDSYIAEGSEQLLKQCQKK